MPSKRAGITVSLKGVEAAWGWWPEEWDTLGNHWVNLAARETDALERIAAPAVINCMS